MPVNAKEKTGLGSPLRRVEHARPRASRVLRRVLIGLAGVCMLSTLTASAGVGAQASARRAPGRAAVVPFPLSVSQFALRRVGGLIVGNATVVNRGNARVRSTTGLLALRQGAGGRATGLRTFSVPALRPGSSTKVTLTTRLVSSLRARSGKYQALVCTDVYSQISRFTPQGNCWSGAKLTIATSRSFPASGPAPNTIIRTGVASLSNRSTAVIRFVSTIGAGTFECSLDAAPWLPCKSPQRYIALVDGPHAFAVRAISASGAADLTPARISWTVPPVAPAVTVRNPINGSTTHERKPGVLGCSRHGTGRFVENHG